MIADYDREPIRSATTAESPPLLRISRIDLSDGRANRHAISRSAAVRRNEERTAGEKGEGGGEDVPRARTLRRAQMTERASGKILATSGHDRSRGGRYVTNWRNNREDAPGDQSKGGGPSRAQAEPRAESARDRETRTRASLSITLSSLACVRRTRNWNGRDDIVVL